MHAWFDTISAILYWIYLMLVPTSLNLNECRWNKLINIIKTPSLPTFSILHAIRSLISWSPFVDIVSNYICLWQSNFFTIGSGIVNVDCLLRKFEFAKQELGLTIAKTSHYIFQQLLGLFFQMGLSFLVCFSNG